MHVTKQHVRHLMGLSLKTDVCGGFSELYMLSRVAEQVWVGVDGF